MGGVCGRWQVLSGSWLKVIAMVTMVVDHGAGHFLSNFAWAGEPLFFIGHHPITWIFILRGIIGRLAFPLFAFLLVEGFRHTHDVKRYLWSLLVCAIITQPCCNLMHKLPWYTFWSGLNVLFTFSVGLLALIVYEDARLSTKKKTCWLLTLMVITFLGRMDYGAVGVSFILLTHLFRKRMDLELVATLGCFFARTPFACFSWILMLMYNGKRGFIHGTLPKYLCYAFYPLHMLAIYGARLWGFG